jgi:hypothetical protein
MAKTKIRFLLLQFAGLAIATHAQPAFVWPLDSPRVISGNYGELRPNHFHAGIDFTTGKELNRQVYSIDEGYVSRIKVSSTGYGRCVYITHPKGYVSVYAHLNSYSYKITQIVRKEQMEKKNYEVEFFPKPHSIRVRKSEIVGLSGNSGNSSGPHLHFEVRDERSETPLNPLNYFKVDDQLAPVVESIAFYDLSDTLQPRMVRTMRVKRVEGQLHPEFEKLTVPAGIIGIAYSGFDRIREGSGENNIYKASLYFDDQLVYAHILDNIDFAENRYVNEFTDTRLRRLYQKCFLPTLYPERMYPAIVNKGRVLLKDSAYHKMKILLSDESGNSSAVEFLLNTAAAATYSAPPEPSPMLADCRRDFISEDNGLRLRIPAGTLYKNTLFELKNEIDGHAFFSILPEANLRNSVELSFLVPERFRQSASKIVIKSEAGVYTGRLQNDTLSFAVKGLGQFKLVEDENPPKLKHQIVGGKKARNKKLREITVLMKDDLSGIGRYAMHVNGEWVIAEYDAKNDHLIYVVDEDTPKGDLRFAVEAEDRVGNSARLEFKVRSAQIAR